MEQSGLTDRQISVSQALRWESLYKWYKNAYQWAIKDNKAKDKQLREIKAILQVAGKSE